MKKFLYIFLTFIVGTTVYGQEVQGLESLAIQKKEIPSLSFLAPQLPFPGLTLTEVDFSKKEVKREVNLVAMMERKRFEQESSYIELESPFVGLSSGEKAMIEVTNGLHFHDRGSNYDYFTGKTKNPALREAQTGLFNGRYSPLTGQSNISPYYYSPYLR
ncbi:hypothetical protein [Salinimicrobium soli]|uniref:hypothetical protein n=1 Tax=Salinimicrobium soli TaxID=1254399 RepID=UPI003AAB359A